MGSSKHNLQFGILASYLWVIVHIGVNFLYVPLLIHSLGKSEYGLYQVVASFLAYINVLEMSLSAGVLRFYCNAKAKGSEKYTENVLAICRGIYRKLTVIIIGIGLAIVWGFRIFYASSFTESEILEGTVMLGLLVLNICITMANALYLACIRGNERVAFEKILSVISQILQPVVCLFVLFRLPYAVIVTLVQVCANLVVSFIRYMYAKKQLNIKVVLFEKNTLLEKQILFFAGGLLMSNIADQIFWKTDQIILAKLYNTATVAVYAVGAQIYTNYMYVGTTVAGVFFPRVSTYYQQDHGMEKISALFIKVGRIAFFLCYMVLSAFIIFGREFIDLWVGEGYEIAYSVALAVMLPFTIDITQNLGLTILQVMDKFSFRARMYFVSALLNIISTIILAKKLSGFGAALSTGLTMLITSGIIMNIYYYKEIHLDILGYWKNIGHIFIKFIPVTLAGFWINRLCVPCTSLVLFVLKLAVYVIVYVAVGYLTVINREEKEMIAKFLLKMARRSK